MAIELIDEIIPKNNADFHMVNSYYVKGGFHEASDEADRDLLPVSRRKIGMLCYCTTSDKTYQLRGGVENINWQLYNPSSTQIQDVNAVISALTNRITELETRVSTLEESLTKPVAIAGTFKAGELRANEGLGKKTSYDIEQYNVAPIPSSLSTNFKKKLKK